MAREVVGITVEYNPFHYGHAYQIEQIKKRFPDALIIVAMSGHFVQRGEPAIIDKFTRAKTAIAHGVDVVLELPYVYATQGAMQFAQGAVDMFKLAKVTHLSFGSECGNLENLQTIASSPINPGHLKESMKTGLSFPKSYSLLTDTMMSNDILGVCYLRAMQGSDIQPILIQRTGNYLDPSMDVQHASAFAIRKALLLHQPIQGSTPMDQILVKQNTLPHMEMYYPYIRTLLLTSGPSRLHQMFLVSEGIEHYLIKIAKSAETFEAFLQQAVTSRYTYARIRRTLVQILTQTTYQEVDALAPMHHLRVLAFSKRGQEWLHVMRKEDVQICSRFATLPQGYKQIEEKVAYTYASIFNEEKRQELLALEFSGALQCNRDFK